MLRISRRNFKLWIYESNFFKCKKINSNERSCSATFTHLNNVKRHIIHQHKDQNITFVMCVLDSKSRRTRHHNSVIFSIITVSTSRRISAIQSIQFSFSIAWKKSATRDSWCCHVSSRSTFTEFLSSTTTQVSVSTSFYSRSSISLSISSVSSSMSMTVCISRNSINIMFTYEIKRSRKDFEQKTLNRLLTSNKSDFDQYYTFVFSDWERTFELSKSCTILFEDWRQSSSLNLMTLFFKDNYLSSEVTRAIYSRFDHATTLIRVTTWFNKWFRTEIEFDNFLECESYKFMNASHLCYHEHCVRHIIYESIHMNQNRKRCCELIRFLRQENRDVFEHCTSHNSSCMMQIRDDDSHVKKIIHIDDLSQHAALTTLEICYIQFDILRQTYDFSATKIIFKSRRYSYRIFESQLSCIFSAIKVTFENLQRFFASLTKRSKLICFFCLLFKIKIFANIVRFWVHIVHRHQTVFDDDRLCEVRRNAAFWQTYWNLYNFDDKRNNLIVTKLRRALRIDFSWTEIFDWQFR